MSNAEKACSFPGNVRVWMEYCMTMYTLATVTRERPKPDLDMLSVHDPKHGPAYRLAPRSHWYQPTSVGKSVVCPKPTPWREWLGPKTRETEAELLHIQAVRDLSLGTFCISLKRGLVSQFGGLAPDLPACPSGCLSVCLSLIYSSRGIH